MRRRNRLGRISYASMMHHCGTLAERYRKAKKTFLCFTIPIFIDIDILLVICRHQTSTRPVETLTRPLGANSTVHCALYLYFIFLFQDRIRLLDEVESKKLFANWNTHNRRKISVDVLVFLLHQALTSEISILMFYCASKIRRSLPAFFRLGRGRLPCTTHIS